MTVEEEEDEPEPEVFTGSSSEPKRLFSMGWKAKLLPFFWIFWLEAFSERKDCDAEPSFKESGSSGRKNFPSLEFSFRTFCKAPQLTKPFAALFKTKDAETAKKEDDSRSEHDASSDSGSTQTERKFIKIGVNANVTAPKQKTYEGRAIIRGRSYTLARDATIRAGIKRDSRYSNCFNVQPTIQCSKQDISLFEVFQKNWGWDPFFRVTEIHRVHRTRNLRILKWRVLLGPLHMR